jgi:hypothetical protein
MATKTRTKKTAPVCAVCGSNEALYITLKNGERLPSYVMRLGQGIFCNECAEATK